MSLINVGYDASGNGNNWTANNIDYDTTSTGTDVMVDVPTQWGDDTGVGGEVRGNYATLNPIASVLNPPTFANGNLEATGPSSGVGVCQTTVAATAGKFYAEVTVTRASDRLDLGIMGSSVSMTSTNYLGTDTNSIAYITSTGVIRKDNTNNQTGLATCTTGDVVGMAVDMDSGSIQFYKNNATVGTAVSFTPSNYGAFLFAQTTSNNTSKGTWNFGQRPFAYTAPSGFACLCTTNLPEPTIVDGGDYMTAYLYQADDTSPKSRTGIGFAPDFLWFKNRTTAFSHALYDIVRGTDKGLQTNSTAAENTYTLMSAFGSDGFTTTTDGSVGNLLNYSTDNYVTWAWKANGSGVSNTAGTIDSTVSANTTSGFSIITYTGNGSSTASIGHGLGVAPAFLMCKTRSSSANWTGYHSSLGKDKIIYLSLDIAPNTSTNFWGSSGPSSSVINFTADGGVNANGTTYVCYAFSPVEGFSAFGSWTGNGSADGPYIFLNFRPRYLLIKKTSDTDTWAVQDSVRNPYNVVNLFLAPNSSGAEQAGSGGAYFDFLSNGFKIRTTSNQVNTNGGTYIYAAFAENPFKYALAR